MNFKHCTTTSVATVVGSFFAISFAISCSRHSEDAAPPSTNPGNGSGNGSTQTGWLLDTSFHPTSTFVAWSAVQSDRRIVVANPTSIGRMNRNGSQDAAFPVSTVSGGEIACIALQPDGKILVGGSFTTFNGVVRKSLIRLNSDGTVDNGFNANNKIDGTVKSLLVQSTGNIVVGGYFYYDYGHPTYRHSGLIRLKPTGAYDPTFAYDKQPAPGTLYAGKNDISCIKPLADGRMYVTGKFALFYDYAYTEYMTVARLLANGSADSTFKWNGGSLTYSYDGTPTGNVVGATVVEQLSDGRIVLGGKFTNIGTRSYNGLAWASTSGALDLTTNQYGYGFVSSIAVMSDNSMFVGSTTNADRPSTSGGGVFLYNTNGTPYAGYQMTYPRYGEVYSIAKEADTSVYVMGKLLDGGTTRGIARIVKR